jgi:hypothetical protein
MNLANMIARLPPGSYPRAVWLINNDVLPALFTLTLGNYPIYLPYGGPVAHAGNPYGMLLGRPIIVSQHAKSLHQPRRRLLIDLQLLPGHHEGRGRADGHVDAPVLRRGRDGVPHDLPHGRPAEDRRADQPGQRQQHAVAVRAARRPLIQRS